MQFSGVHLQYSFKSQGQHGADLQHPLFDLLRTMREKGSIQQAANALGASYRHVWGALKNWEAELGQPLVHWAQGQPARLTPFAERLLSQEARVRAAFAPPQLDALRSELSRTLSEALHGPQPTLCLHASLDPAVPLLRDQLQAQGLQLTTRATSAVSALQALAAGQTGLALVTLPALLPSGLSGGLAPCALQGPMAQALAGALGPSADSGFRFLPLMRREQGLMLPRGNPRRLRGLADLQCQRVMSIAPALRFVARPPGSATRCLTQQLWSELGLDPLLLPGLHETGEPHHLAAAAAVASGQGDVAIGLASAARQFGLDFVPLRREHCYLAVAPEVQEQPELAPLRSVLQAPAWAEALAVLPGHGPLTHAGEWLTLAEVLAPISSAAPEAAIPSTRREPALAVEGELAG